MRFLDATCGKAALVFLIASLGSSASLAQTTSPAAPAAPTRPLPGAQPRASTGRPRSFAVLNERLRMQPASSDAELKKRLALAGKETGVTTVPGQLPPGALVPGAGLGGFPTRSGNAPGQPSSLDSLADRLRRQGL